MSDETLTPETIWEDDLFGRKAEAELLIGYLETVSAIPSLRQDHQGFTLAVDARYGEGKTFFLKRLAKHLEITHPVAFVDAWADDLADEPLTALAATLKKALDPLIKQSTDIRSKFDTVMEKTGRIAKIVGIGILKKGASAAIGAVAVQAAENALAGTNEAMKDGLENQANDSGNDAVEIAEKAFTSVAPGKLMDDRIARFEEGQKAIREMKESLAALVEALEPQRRNRPIFIIIDELDRCRPTYAVKLLEEIKHLFDVAGIVFILGLHGDQLSHSISAAYGAGFDSKAYLRRFFNRQYRLAEPDLSKLLEVLCENAGLENVMSSSLTMVSSRTRPDRYSLGVTVARYMTAYGLSARNAFEIVDILQTCFALGGNRPLHINYLLPLIAGHVLGLQPGELPKQIGRSDWMLFNYTDRFGREGKEYTFEEMASSFQKAVNMSREELHQAVNSESVSYEVNAVFETSDGVNGRPVNLSSVSHYPKLISTVTRFKNPNLPT